jgi:hypothetical protein
MALWQRRLPKGRLPRTQRRSEAGIFPEPPDGLEPTLAQTQQPDGSREDVAMAPRIPPQSATAAASDPKSVRS